MILVTALQSETRPLVEHFDLDGRQAEGPFQRYGSDGLELIRCGPGKTAAAAAVAYLAGRLDGPGPRFWLNVGVAGHGDRPTGDVVLAGEVVDGETGERWYPQPVFPVEPELETVRTVPTPERTFEHPDAYDMEAAGFYDAALRFSTVERVHVLKIISDGPDQSPDDVTAEAVERLVGRRVDAVEAMLDAERALPERSPSSEHLDTLCDWVGEHCRLSVTRKRQFRRLAERWHAVYPDRDLRSFLEPERREVNELMDRLETEIESAPVRYE